MIFSGRMAPRIKIEDILPSGEKISITLEGGEISRERILQVLDLLNLMAGSETSRRAKSLKENIWNVLLDNFGEGEWFTVNEAYAAVRQVLKDVAVTAVSSYISRFLKEGRLEKTGRKPHTRYRIKRAYARVF